MANAFKRKVSNGVGTSLTQVGTYTVPSSTEVTIIGLSLANITSGDVTASVYINSGHGNSHLLKDAPVPTGQAVVVVGGDQKVVLETGDSVYVYSDTTAALDVVMSILEIT